AIKAGEEVQRLADSQLFGEPGLLQRNADPLAKFALWRLPGLAKDLDLAVSGRQQAFENLDGRGLPCSVWAQQPEAFSFINGQIEPANRLDFAVVGLAQVSTLDV